MKLLFTIASSFLALAAGAATNSTYYKNRFATNFDSVFNNQVVSASFNNLTGTVVAATGAGSSVFATPVIMTNTLIIGSNTASIHATNQFQVAVPTNRKAVEVDTNGVLYANGTGGSVFVAGLTNLNVTSSRIAFYDVNKNLTNAGASGSVPINADGTATTSGQLVAGFSSFPITNGQSQAFNITSGATNTSSAGWNGNAQGITNNWQIDEFTAIIPNVQLQNGNRFFPVYGGATSLIAQASIPLPSGPGYVTNMTIAFSTNSFSTTNFTVTLLTNRINVTPVASLLTGTLLGATGIPLTNVSGVSCILTTNETIGCFQVLNSVANTTIQTFSVRWQFCRQVNR